MKLPIYNHREIVGYATTAKQATRIVRGLLQTIPRGWRVTARLRDTELTGLPAGWIYSIHP